MIEKGWPVSTPSAMENKFARTSSPNVMAKLDDTHLLVLRTFLHDGFRRDEKCPHLSTSF